MVTTTPKAAQKLGMRAKLAGGSRVSLTQTEWDVAGRCENPTRVSVDGKAYRTQRLHYYRDPRKPIWDESVDTARWSLHGAINDDVGTPHTVYLDVPCGHCGACLRARAALWKRRMSVECERWPRTWFVTLTAKPHQHMLWRASAFRRLQTGGTAWASLNPGEQFSEVCTEMGRDLTRYVKRCRKASTGQLRAVWVVEQHKSGNPHIHGLVHEVETSATRERVLRTNWRKHGFAEAVLLDKTSESHALSTYVTKACGYISKSLLVRVRASKHYGDASYEPRSPHRPSEVTTPNSLGE